MPDFGDIRLVFDATSAGAHARHWEVLRHNGIRVLDLTPAAIGPFCVPVVNLEDHIDAPNLNMVTCGGQATVPIVAAVNAVGVGVLRRDRVVDLVEIGRPGHPSQHRRVHRNDCGGTESRRRRTKEQSGDHPQPGRSANSDA